MGRIVAQLSVQNATVPDNRMELSGLVDTGASHVTLPMAWKERFGKFLNEETVPFHTADHATQQGLVCGPAIVQLDGFRKISTEVLFIEMQPVEGEQYEVLIGYLALEPSLAAVDMFGYRLVKARALDLK